MFFFFSFVFFFCSYFEVLAAFREWCWHLCPIDGEFIRCPSSWEGGGGVSGPSEMPVKTLKPSGDVFPMEKSAEDGSMGPCVCVTTPDGGMFYPLHCLDLLFLLLM